MEYTATYNTDIGIRKSTNQDSVAVRIIDTPEKEDFFIGRNSEAGNR